MNNAPSNGAGAGHQVMRELNRSLVLDLVKHRSPISRAEIAKATSLAKPTVSAIVEQLIGEHLVREIGIGQASPGGGRPPILLEFNTRSQFVVGVHLGVRRTEIMVADAAGVEIGRLERRTPRRSAAAVLKATGEAVEEAIAAAGAARSRVAAVGVCVPGLMDLENGVCLLAPNLGWTDVPVRDVLQDALKVPVFVHNAAQAAAVAETLEGAAKGASEVVLLYIGSGIGSGVLTDGRLYRGVAGIAGEIGHCLVPGATDRCNCGKVGCLETVASGPSIARAAERALRDGRASSITLSGRKRTITAEDVSNAAREGDALANEILERAGHEIGIAASWLINLFNPEVLVVVGGLVGAGEALLDPLREAALEHALPQAAARVDIRTSELHEGTEVRGAVLVALQYSETFYRLVFQT